MQGAGTASQGIARRRGRRAGRDAIRRDRCAAHRHRFSRIGRGWPPRALPSQEVNEFALAIEPAPVVQSQREDYFGNGTDYFSIGSPHERLVVTARSRVRVASARLPERTPAWQVVRDRCASDVLTADSAAGEFRFDSPYIIRKPAFADYAVQSFPKDRPLLDGIRDFTARIYRDFRFNPAAPPVP